MKITNEQIENWEAESMIDSLGNCLELNNEFIKRYCGENVAKLLLQIPGVTAHEDIKVGSRAGRSPDFINV